MRDALGDVGLQPQRAPEGHRGRHVDRDPRGQRALGHVQAHVRLAGARRRRRVDVADVVADLVRAELRELGARPDARGAPVAGQRARHPLGACASSSASTTDCGMRPGPWRARPAVASAVSHAAADRGGAVRSGSATAVEHALEDLVGGDAVAQRVVGEHDAVAQDVGARGRGRRRCLTCRRPRSSASARAACTRPIGPRGLAPNSIDASRSASP